MVIDDAKAAYDMLTANGIKADEVEGHQWGTFTGFSDPDGNKWALQPMPNWG